MTTQPLIDILVSSQITLPRWLVASLLTTSLCALFGAGAWWWVTWPDRSSQEFLRSMAAADFERAEAMLGPKAADVKRDLRFIIDMYDEDDRNELATTWMAARVEGAKPRALRDFALGTQDFECRMDVDCHLVPTITYFDITAGRGKILNLQVTKSVHRLSGEELHEDLGW
jgi:hypothetical protein